MKIQLQPFTEADIDRLIGWIPTVEFLLQWGGSGFRFPLDRKQLLSHLSASNQMPPDRLIYKAVDADTGAVVGHGEILAIDPYHRSATLGRLLVGDPQARGKGLGQKIVRALVEICFQELKLHRVALRVYDFNQRAIRCYEKAGFTHEGLQRDVHRIGQEYWSVHTMGILEDEWRRPSYR
jgi:RimJ/RimL family protein N-acetyltransferase